MRKVTLIYTNDENEVVRYEQPCSDEQIAMILQIMDGEVPD
jgi:hypothetical protein